MMKLSQQVFSKDEPRMRKQKRVPFYLSQTAREKARKLFVNSIQICGQILRTAVNSGSHKDRKKYDEKMPSCITFKPSITCTTLCI
jgi:hypothetical protein